MQLKMSPAKWRPFCLGLNVLVVWKSLTVFARKLEGITDDAVRQQCTYNQRGCWHGCRQVLSRVDYVGCLVGLSD